MGPCRYRGFTGIIAAPGERDMERAHGHRVPAMRSRSNQEPRGGAPDWFAATRIDRSIAPTTAAAATAVAATAAAAAATAVAATAAAATATAAPGLAGLGLV